MKTLIAALFLGISALVVVSCKKPNEAPNGNSKLSIVGKWHVVSDTTWFISGGVIQDWSKMYIGTPKDYYNFTANGGLSIVEGPYASDTLLYKLVADTLKISYSATHPDFSPMELNTFTITTFTQHKLVITSVFAGNLTSVGYDNEIMVFSR